MSVQRERSWPFMMARRFPGGVRMTLPGENSRGKRSESGLSFMAARSVPLGGAILPPRLQIGSPFCALLAAKLVQIVPAEEAGVVTIVEADAHRIVADWFERLYADVLLAGHDLLLRGAVALNFGARRFHAEIFGREDELFAAVEGDSEARLVCTQS